MAQRDYAKRTTTRKPQKKTLPGWAWLVAGLLLGLFVAFLVYLQQQGGGGSSLKELLAKPKPAATDARAVKKSEPAKAPQVTKKPDGINFDFYNILPEMEVVIPEEELNKGTTTTQEKASYFLQVGSFKSEQEAEARKAELFLLNFTPTVQKVTVDGSQTWHRVRLGPYTDRRKLDAARRQLQDNGIDVIVLKEKGG